MAGGSNSSGCDGKGDFFCAAQGQIPNKLSPITLGSDFVECWLAASKVGVVEAIAA